MAGRAEQRITQKRWDKTTVADRDLADWLTLRSATSTIFALFPSQSITNSWDVISYQES